MRVVPLPAVVVDPLPEPLRAYPSTTLVFTNSVGTPLRHSASWTEWNRALQPPTESSEVCGLFADYRGVTRHITAVQGPESG